MRRRMPDAVATGAEPVIIVEAMAGGSPGEQGGKHVKYMLLIYGEENALDETEREQCYRESSQLLRCT